MKHCIDTYLKCLVAAATIFTAAPVIAEQPQYGGTLTVAMADDAKSLDPALQVNFSERQPLYLIFNTLFKLKPDFSLEPELAQSWSYSDDGLSLTIVLRDGVKFHDGTDFDARAVKWNLEHRMDPNTKSVSETVLKSMIKNISVVDSKTVLINLKMPSPSLLGMLAQREGFMASPKSATELGDKFGVNPVGTGAFKFKEWALGRIVLEKNPDYWEKGKPYLDRVIFQLVANSTIVVPRLMTKELDAVAQLSPFDIRSLERNQNIKLYPTPGAKWISLQMDNAQAPFNDVRVRKAIAYGLDRPKIVETVTGGKGTLANGPTPPGLWWYDPNLPDYPHDPKRARELLAEAGHPDGISVTLAVPPDSEYRPLSQLVQAQLKEAGINVAIKPVSGSEWAPMMFAGTINFLPIKWTQRPDPDGLLSMLLEGTMPTNNVHYKNPEFDALLQKGRAEKDINKRKEIYSKAQQILGNDLPYVNLMFSVEYEAVQSNIHNFEWIPDIIPRYREVWKAH
jgi:peptide/nickel transport system substrate-binding protein